MARALIFLAAFFVVLSARAQDADPLPETYSEDIVEIPYETFTLDNGLTVIIHEDHKAPIVAVNVWYHVGSKNERPGKTGFAHLFEHLMFNGSENFNDDYFQVLEAVGATNLNGTTNRDRTNYFQNVPVNALDQALWMESDRMGHMLGAVDQARLDEQRGVVQNEKRQGENQPYGTVSLTIAENTYPEGHPYSWSVIGSMDDLNAASLDDVHTWFETYYGPQNAVLAIAGDIDVETAREKVTQYFGDIKPGVPIAKQEAWTAKMQGTRRMSMQDRVPLSRVYKVWNVPGSTTADSDYLGLVANVLASGKNSRLYRRLIYDSELASQVSAFVYSGEIGSQFRIQATALDGTDLRDIEAAIDDELATFMAEGPTERETERVKTQYIAGFVRGLEQIGGFGGKSDVLAQHHVYYGRADAYKTTLERIGSATPGDLHQAAVEWLSDGEFILDVHPFPALSASAEGADRSMLPENGAPPEARFPSFSRHMLDSGMEVIVATRPSVPVVSMQLLVDAGFASDFTTTPGLAMIAMNMMDEGTEGKTSLELSEELAFLGATLSTGSNLDQSIVSMNALTRNLEPSLALFSEVVLHPAFPTSDFERLQRLQLSTIQQEQQNPVAMMLRVTPGLLYGDDHPYSQSFTGSGTIESVRSITTDDLRRFHSTWFKPNNATLIVVGDVTAETVLPLVERQFEDWEPGDIPGIDEPTTVESAGDVVYLLDRPGAVQTVVVAGQVALPKDNPYEAALATANTVFGGAFVSRINMNLREDKGWSYGAFSLMLDARHQRPALVFAPVQTDKTVETIREIIRELTEFRSDRPITEDELQRAINSQVLTLPGQWETNGAVMNAIAQVEHFGFEDDHVTEFPESIKRLTLDEVNDGARRLIDPDHLTWIIVGDLAEIEDGIRGLNLGDVRQLDADGNRLE